MKNCKCGEHAHQNDCCCQQGCCSPSRQVVEATGAIHNRVLVKVASDPCFAKASERELFEIISQVAGQELRNFCLSGAPLSFDELKKLLDQARKNPKIFINELFFSGKIDSVEKENLNFIAETVSGATADDVVEIDMKLRAFESIIFADRTLSCQEKTLIGMASSIGRNSLALGAEVLKNPSSPLAKNFKARDINSGNVGSRFSFGDVFGAIIGCLICGGTIGCITCGIVGGALGSASREE